MKIFIIVYLFGLLSNIASCWHPNCESHNSADLFLGRYCAIAGIVTPNLSWPQCKLLCLHNSGCQGVNYNITSNSCTRFTETCPRAMNHHDMSLALFTTTEPQQCIEWIPRENGHPVGDRSLTEDTRRFAARIRKDGGYFIGYILMNVFHCYALGNQMVIKSKTRSDYPCEYLRIRDDCTVYYMNYELGTTVPPNALIGGYTAEGFPVYIGHRPGETPMSYIPGYNRLLLGFRNVTGNVEILVML